MRTKLKNMGKKKRYCYIGTFERYGFKNSYGYEKETVLLLHIIEKESGKEVADHLWFNKTKGFIKANPKQGDKLEFFARVDTYTKGYQGYKEDIRLLYPREEDYKLSRPTHIRNLTHPEQELSQEQVDNLYQSPKMNYAPAKENSWETEPATISQIEYIKAICSWLKCTVPEINTKKEASEWLDKQDLDTYSRERRRNLAIARGLKTYHSICKCIESGMTKEEICQNLNISPSTYRKYKKKYLEEKDKKASYD